MKLKLNPKGKYSVKLKAKTQNSPKVKGSKYARK